MLLTLRIILRPTIMTVRILQKCSSGLYHRFSGDPFGAPQFNQFMAYQRHAPNLFRG